MYTPDIYMIAREFNVSPIPWERDVYDMDIQTINNETVIFIYLKNNDLSRPCYETYQGMRVEYIVMD